MKKVINKILFIYNIVLLGSDFWSKFKLFINSLIIQLSIYIKFKPIKYTVWIGNKKNKIRTNFIGTLDELHALTEIFIEECYKPKNAPKTIIDMGANIGLATIWFKLNYPESTIHAYEPNPEVYKVLKINSLQLSNVTVFNEGVSMYDSYIEFNVGNRSFSSSIYPIINSKKIKIKSTSFDKTIERIGDNVDLIKMDIEGAEFSVIRLSKKLSSVKEIIGEVHPEKSGNDVNDLIKNLSKTHMVKSNNKEKSIFHAYISE